MKELGTHSRLLPSVAGAVSAARQPCVASADCRAVPPRSRPPKESHSYSRHLPALAKPTLQAGRPAPPPSYM
jgi:hypothetical protein